MIDACTSSVTLIARCRPDGKMPRHGLLPSSTSATQSNEVNSRLGPEEWRKCRETLTVAGRFKGAEDRTPRETARRCVSATCRACTVHAINYTATTTKTRPPSATAHRPRVSNITRLLETRFSTHTSGSQSVNGGASPDHTQGDRCLCVKLRTCPRT